MRTVDCIVVHDSRIKICNVTVITREGNQITLLSNPDPVLRYEYRTFKDMYRTVLNLLKNNDFKVQRSKQIDTYLYNIQWIDCNYPWEVSRYFYNPIGEKTLNEKL